MYLRDVKEVITVLAKSKCPLSSILWGPTGIGKSSIVKQAAEELEYNLVDIRLSQREAVDILGMPFTSHVTIKDKVTGEEKQIGTLDHYSPKWFVEALHKGKTILFLDELNRARPEVLQAVFELALDRRLNGQKLPDDVVVISACNPPDQRYDTVEFDDALAARFMHIHVQPDQEVWMDWAKSTKKGTDRPNIHPHITNFIASSKDALNKIQKEDSEFPVELSPTSRSWEFVSYVEDLSLSDTLKKECIRGIVGNELAIQYMKSRNSEDRPISVEEILMMTDAVRERIKKMSAVKESKGKIRLDLLKETCRDIERNIDKYNDDPETFAKWQKNVLDFVEMVPTDLAVSLLQKIFKLDTWPQAIWKREPLVERLKEMKNAQTNNRANPGPSKK